MDILVFFGITLAALIFITILRREYEEYAVLLSVLVGVIILLRLIGRLTELVRVFTYLAQKAQVQPDYLATIFKVMGVAYLAGFGAQICKDAGESALGLRLELAGKIIILFMAVPVMVAIFEMVLRLF
ncbi:MAG TPA: stage III sporulation protein AD [Firmicutes bacterium]|uniref:Stage III sporulation protein AD n=1 Tax=Capillibacterium thermochitinicola TaxID=2699427 RepID=A0A8J6I0U5_9FIRM|nr:stage III sporulation protein AD [Capillibacterium thermochitinicola]HHW11783.1 stage III sporulation protein AD [Bacillota bacterium]